MLGVLIIKHKMEGLSSTIVFLEDGVGHTVTHS